MATGMFNPALVNPSTNLNTEQKARASALLVAHQVRTGSSVTELIRLAEYVVIGSELPGLDRIASAAMAENIPVEHRPDPWQAFGAHTTAANFGDLDNEAGLRGELREEDDGLG
jgi:hypothetical protein